MLERQQNLNFLERIAQTIDTPVMACHEKLTITYVNPAMVKLLRSCQETLRQTYPGFDIQQLRRMLEDLGNEGLQSTISLAGFSFRLKTYKLQGGDGGEPGFVVQWEDITESLRREDEIRRVVAAIIAKTANQRVLSRSVEPLAVGESKFSRF